MSNCRYWEYIYNEKRGRRTLGNSEYKTWLSKKNKTEKPQGYLQDCWVSDQGGNGSQGPQKTEWGPGQGFSNYPQLKSTYCWFCFIFPNPSQTDGFIQNTQNELLGQEKILRHQNANPVFLSLQDNRYMIILSNCFKCF